MRAITAVPVCSSSRQFANNIELARILIAKGANVNNVDELGFTPLLDAAGNGDRNAAMVKLLIEHGAQVNVKSSDTIEICQERPPQAGASDSAAIRCAVELRSHRSASQGRRRCQCEGRS